MIERLSRTAYLRLCCQVLPHQKHFAAAFRSSPLSHASTSTGVIMNHDAVLHLDIYSDDSGIHIGELLYALHEVVHATSGENTLAMVYVRNKAERAAAGWQKDTFRLLDRLCGNDLQARITFIPNGASPRWGAACSRCVGVASQTRDACAVQVQKGGCKLQLIAFTL